MSTGTSPVTDREHRDDDLRGLEPSSSIVIHGGSDDGQLDDADESLISGAAGADVEPISEAAIAALTGRGLPLINHLSLPPPSIVTDLGDSLEELNWVESSSTYESQPITYDGSADKLANQLAAVICLVPQRSSGFVPRRQLRQIMDNISVEREMDRIEASFWKTITLCNCFSLFRRKFTSNEQLAQIICGTSSRTSTLIGRLEPRSRSFRKLFAILLFIKRPGNIRRFIEEGVCDADLPLTTLMRGHNIVSLCRKSAPNEGLRSVHAWRSKTLDDFERTQWKFLAPFFSRGRGNKVENYILDDFTILPFKKRERVHRGGQATVYKVQIHPEHHNFDDFKCEGGWFAVKELHGREEEYRGEAGALRKLSGAHPHIIPLLATYEQGNCFGLIFPWAECNLMTYWTTENKNPDPSIKTVLWMARQCLGIVGGLKRVHRFMEPSVPTIPATKTNSMLAVASAASAQTQTVYSLFGRHGDIKPANLLWYPNPDDQEDMGTIKISDFGVGEFSTSESQLSSSGSVSYSAPYRPPECDLPDFAATGSYDVWTLGCLFLEFITWYIGGSELLQKLEDCRKKFTCSSDHVHTFFEVIGYENPDLNLHEATIKPEIQDFVRRLRRAPECSVFLADFLDLVQDDLLIVEPRLGEPGKRRPKCSEIYHRLQQMIQRCVDDDGYAMYPSSQAANQT